MNIGRARKASTTCRHCLAAMLSVLLVACATPRCVRALKAGEDISIVAGAEKQPRPEFEITGIGSVGKWPPPGRLVALQEAPWRDFGAGLRAAVCTHVHPVGGLGGGIAGAVSGQMKIPAEQEREKINSNLQNFGQSHDPRVELMAALRDKAVHHWKLTDQPAAKVLTVRLLDAGLEATRDKDITLSMGVGVSFNSSGADPGIPGQKKCSATSVPPAMPGCGWKTRTTSWHARSAGDISTWQKIFVLNCWNRPSRRMPIRSGTMRTPGGRRLSGKAAVPQLQLPLIALAGCREDEQICC